MVTSETISDCVVSVMQDGKYVLSHLLPICNLLVQGPKITYQDVEGANMMILFFQCEHL